MSSIFIEVDLGSI